MTLGVAVRPKGGGDSSSSRVTAFCSAQRPRPGRRGGGRQAVKARGRLLMREALELALYSFRYLEDVTMVAVLLPPSPKAETEASTSTATDTEPTRAVFYRPGDLLAQLQVPLSRTLSPETPTPKTMKAPETGAIDSLVLREPVPGQRPAAQGGAELLGAEGARQGRVTARGSYPGHARTGSGGYLGKRSGSVRWRRHIENVEPRVVCTSFWCTQPSQSPAGTPLTGCRGDPGAPGPRGAAPRAA